MDREKIIEDYLSRHTPEMIFGSMANDNGNLIIEPEELDSFIEKDPQSKKFIRRLMGSKEFIQNIPRYCLWLVDSTPNELRSIKPIRERVEAVRKYRLASKRAATRKLADTPWLFGEIRQPKSGNYLIVPRVSSERREYIPIGFLDSETIATDAVQILLNATLDRFGIMTSSVHMAWMRTVCGRLKSDYRYSNTLVYNNFPWPEPNDSQRAIIEQSAQSILEIRSHYPNSSLADLYDPLIMPYELRKAHEANDKAVMKAYGFSSDMEESEIVAELMKMYKKLTEGK